MKIQKSLPFKKLIGVLFIPLLFILLNSCELAKELYNANLQEDGVTAVMFSLPTNNQTITRNYTFLGTTYDKDGVDEVTIYALPTNGGAGIIKGAEVSDGKLGIFRADISFSNDGVYLVQAKSVNKSKGISRSTPIVIKVYQSQIIDIGGGDSTNTNTTSTNTNTGQVSTNTNVIITDTTPPSISITSHTNNHKVGSGYTLSGSAVDNGSGVKNVYVRLDNGVFNTANYQNGSWTKDMTISEGFHTNFVFASDNSENISSTNSIILEYETGLPFVSIASPSSGDLLNSATYDISGTAGVEMANITLVELKVNDQLYQTVTGTTNWTKSSVNLIQGSNTFRARVVADNGKTNYSGSVSVMVDTSRPVSAISAPLDGAVISNNQISISGTAVDIGIGIEGVYMAIDDEVYSKFSSSASWSLPVTLNIGTHTIKVFAKDKIGLVSDTNSITIDIQDAFIVYMKKPASWTDAYIHYWGGDCGSTIWPGELMTEAPEVGTDWYKFVFDGSQTSIVFNQGNDQNKSVDLSRDRKGYYYTDNQWYDSNPEGPQMPEISADPAPGLYTNTIQVTLTSISTSDDIYFTLNGDVPTTSSSLYSTPITVNTNMTIKAIGKNDTYESTSVSFEYTIDASADLQKPSITNTVPTGHTNATSLNVSFTVYDNKSEAVTAYYTTDGTEASISDTVYATGDASSGLAGSAITITNTTQFNFLVVDAAGNQTSTTFYYHMGDFSATRMDPRQETIYFLLTARWYDGDPNNSIGDEWCSWTEERVTPGSDQYVEDNGFTGPEDVAWRGDFKGLVEKMDYIKALGFTAIWLTPVVQNRSPLCYHGYHAWDVYSEDDRLESPGYDFQRVVDEAHSRGMKICLDIVLNHSGRFGLKDFAEIKYNTDPALYPDPETWTPNWEYDGLTSPGVLAGEDMPPYSRVSDVRPFDANDLSHFPYLATDTTSAGYMAYEWPSTESYCKTIDGVWANGGQPGSLTYAEYKTSERLLRGHGSGFPTGSGSFDNFPDAHFDSCHEDCPDLNTENPTVQNYLIEAYKRYIDMGVDMFRVDTVMHMHKQTLNDAFWPAFLSYADLKKDARGGSEFFIFGEVANFVNMISDKPAQLQQPNYTWDDTVLGSGNSANHWMDGNNYRTPDYSHKAPAGNTYEGHVSVIDIIAHNGFVDGPWGAYGRCLGNDSAYNDATYLVWYTDSHDYGPNKGETRWGGDFAAAWSMMFTFRGIPVVYYGSEIRFAEGKPNDWPGGGANGVNMSLEKTGRSYYGPNLEGTVTATDFGEYTASGAVATTLSSDLSTHLRNLNKIRLSVPALQMGQYSTDGGSGGWANYKRRYDGDYNNEGFVQSYCLVGVGQGSHGFSGVLDGSYYDVVSGNTYTASGGNVSFNVAGNSGGLAVLVYEGTGFYAPDKSLPGRLESTPYFGN